MSPKKRALKKAKKAARAKKAVRGKKLAAKKKPVGKKVAAAKKNAVIKKKAARKAGPGAVSSAAHRTEAQQRAGPVANGLGDWFQDNEVEQDRPASLFEDDDLAPDYGGSK